MTPSVSSPPSEALRAQTTRDREVAAAWVATHRAGLRLVDVREPHELQGPLGAIEGAENLPLLQLLSRASTFDPSQPLVLVCRSGRRSGMAAAALADAGFTAVASLEGGMLAWNQEVLHRAGIHEEEKAANTRNLAEAAYRTNGLPEVSAPWVAAHVGRFRLVDIREAHELAMTGRIPQAEHIPMGTFLSQADGFDRSAPLVVTCASGGRSGRVVRALEAAGFTAVASMEGGMFGWKAFGLPVA